MKQKLWVMSGDVLSSRGIKDRDAFQKRLEKACSEINTTCSDHIYSDFKILKGIDEIEGVLLDISKVYEIITLMLKRLYPGSMRFSLAFDYIDTALESRDVSKMDGPAFHKAYDIMHGLKRSKLTFDMSSDDEITDALIAGEINSILLLKKQWSAKQHLIAMEYRKTMSQSQVAQALGITQQAVSKSLVRSYWREIRVIEGKLEKVLKVLSIR